MENEYGASTDTQFAVQISTEVRVQNLDKIAPQYEIQNKDKDEKKEKRETFLEFMVRYPYLYSEQEDKPYQSYPLVDQDTGG